MPKISTRLVNRLIAAMFNAIFLSRGIAVITGVKMDIKNSCGVKRSLPGLMPRKNHPAKQKPKFREQPA
ncbi:MAG: hypothetical protein L3J62_10030 [Gammaproteobacteria bacterium]|nr:hypothetical protein [Gammaproteobacteria bacterium]